ncbi:MAG: pectinesterase family protein [Candidatus Acidiferrum sp.]
MRGTARTARFDVTEAFQVDKFDRFLPVQTIWAGEKAPFSSLLYSSGVELAMIRSIAIILACGLGLFMTGRPIATESWETTVGVDGSGNYKTVQEAIDEAPATGGVIRIKPGRFREVIYVNKPHISLLGLGADPSQVVLTYDLNNASVGSTFKSASTTVIGDSFYAENLTFENSFTRDKNPNKEGSQAVALRVTGDRAVFRKVRILGHQDTLYASSKGCESEQGLCHPARQYFADCFVEGDVDFIFGDAMAFFENCEIHGLAHPTVMLTAQSKHNPEEKSGYVFDHCRLTADAGADKVYLGRAWRAYATVVFLNTDMQAKIEPAGWLEWVHDGKPSLQTAFFAEYNSSGPGANPSGRESYSKLLTATEAAKFEAKDFLAGDDQWDPTIWH